MSKKEILVFNPDGTVSTELDGYTDATCIDHAQRTNQILAGMGVVVQTDDLEMKNDGGCPVPVKLPEKVRVGK